MEMDKLKRYPEDHWLRSTDHEKALAAYRDQQSKAYSRRKNAYIKELLGNLEGKRFLDYGCGAGWFSVYAAQNGALEVVGIDAERAALDTAGYFAKQQGVIDRCKFIQSPEFPQLLTDTRFDVILMKDVIEHVQDDRLLLQRASEALTPGGLLVVSTQNALSLNYLLEGLYQHYLKGNRSWTGWDETHLRFYTPMSLRAKLEAAGYTVKKNRSVYIVPYTFSKSLTFNQKYMRVDGLSRIDRVLGYVFPYNRLGWNIIISAESSPLIKIKTKKRVKSAKMPVFQPV